MITLDRVSRRYGEAAVVDDVSLEIPDGAFCVLIGTSGSGKSTTLRMINRLIAPSAGRILLDGTDTATIPDLRLRMGYAIQSIGLFPHWSIARNIATVPALLGWTRAKRKARVRDLMQTLGLDPALAVRYPHELSGGQQQRVGVARALAADPDVLLMDEPFGALDPPTRAGLQSEMRRLHSETGKTIVFVTHDMEEALGLATLLVILDRGRLVQAGPPRQLLASPGSDFVREFVGGGEAGLRLLALDTVAQRMRPPDWAKDGAKDWAKDGASDGANDGAEGPAIAPAASLRAALALMTETRVGRLVVREGDAVLGTLLLEDVWRDGAASDRAG